MYDGKKSLLESFNEFPAATAITAAAWTLPAVSPLFMGLQVFAPLPVCYYLAALGFRKGVPVLAAGLLVTAVIAVLAGRSGALVFTLLMLPVGASLARDIAAGRKSQWSSGAKALLAMVLGWLAWSLVHGITNQGGTGLYQDILAGLDGSLVEIGTTIKEGAGLEPEQALEVETAIRGFRDLLPRLLPGLLLTTMLNTAFFNMVAGQWLLARRKEGLVPWPPFGEWRLPEPLVALVILAGFGVLVPVDPIRSFGMNLLLATANLYFFQGLAVLVSFLGRWAVPGPLRALILLLVMIQAYGILLLAVTGLVDVWADFRTRKPKPAPDDDNN